jgi:hypothetical protein
MCLKFRVPKQWNSLKNKVIPVICLLPRTSSFSFCWLWAIPVNEIDKLQDKYTIILCWFCPFSQMHSSQWRRTVHENLTIWDCHFPTRKRPAALQDQSLREVAVVNRLQSHIQLIISHAWVTCLGLLVPKFCKVIWLSNVSTLNVSYYGYFRNASNVFISKLASLIQINAILLFEYHLDMLLTLR